MELLVVTAIVALLIAILLPSLQEARELARSTACAANVKQINTGVFLYLIDHQFHYPNHDAIGASNVLFGGTRGHSGEPPIHYPHASNTYGANRRPTNRYIGVDTDADPDQDIPVHLCPSDRGTPDVYAAFGLRTYWLFGSSYNYNYYAPAAPNPRTLSVSHTTDLQHPAAVVVIGDATIWNFWMGVSSERGMRWHDVDKPTANIGFADGHVAYLEVLPGNSNTNYTFLPK